MSGRHCRIGYPMNVLGNQCDPVLTLGRVDFAYRLRMKTFEKEKILMNSKLVYLAVIGDLLKIRACKLHLQLIRVTLTV